jgi:hypothetical protein
MCSKLTGVPTARTQLRTQPNQREPSEATVPCRAEIKKAIVSCGSTVSPTESLLSHATNDAATSNRVITALRVAQAVPGIQQA